MRTLLVDDDHFFMTLLSTLMRKSGGPIEAVYDGEAALKLLRSERFDFLITDLLMEGMSGIELIQRVLSEQLVDAQNILVVTAEPESSASLDWVRNARIQYLQKPFTAVQLGKALRRISYNKSRCA